MKSYYTLLVFILFGFTSFAQTLDVAYVRKDGNWRLIDKKGNFLTEKLFEHDSLFVDCSDEGMVVIEKGFKFGFYNLHTRQVLPAVYDSVTSFSKGVSLVKKNDKWLAINIEGHEVPINTVKLPQITTDDADSLLSLVPATPNQFIAPWNNTEAYNNDRILCYQVLANKDCSCHKMTNYYGFINRKAQWVIPANYEWADIYALGLAAVSQGTGDGKTIGYIDMDGKWVIQPIFQDCGRFRAIKIN